jgi:PPK2 family polyphosphate:nucleotide phosphotransferase
MKISEFRIPPGKSIHLRSFDPAAHESSREKAAKKLQDNIERLAGLQDVLYAQDTYAMLIILQAMDAAGKDSVIKHVMTGLNPQGCRVVSFKEPSSEELRHDYLWRCVKELPERGRIGIFNRSYYEEVLIVRVHSGILLNEHLPADRRGGDIWNRRFRDIADFERYLADNGTIMLKFFLNVSQREQSKRFLERLNRPDKHWKFSIHDLEERKFWHQYQKAYEEMLGRTSTQWAPWYVVPADHKWFTRLVVSEIICRRLEELGLKYPVLTTEQKNEIRTAKRILSREA